MPVDIKTKLQNSIHQVLVDNNFDVDINEINLSQSKDNKNGDYASNVALKFAARFKLKPFELGQIIAKNICENFIDHIEIAGPGFLNFFLKHNALEDELKKVIALEDSYGRGEKKNIKINVEFVSANPTGDLHLGHARIASLGDSICRLFSFAGYDVTREYYVNDAGNQVDNLALSLRARYHQAFGENYPIPEDGYHGEDIIDIANKIKDEFADKYLEDNDDNLLFFKNYGIQAELDKINRDLKDFRVSFDVYTSERDIRKNHHVEDVLKNKYKKYTYEQNGAIFLKTTDFLDDKDRAVVKSDGSFINIEKRRYRMQDGKRDASTEIVVPDRDYSFIPPSFQGSTIRTYDELSTYVGAELSKRTGKLFTYNARGELCILGDDVGEFRASGELRTTFNLFQKEAYVKADAYIKNVTPAFFQRHYHSRYFWWDNDFNMIQQFYVGGEVNVESTQTKLSAGVESIQNYVYFGKDGMPVQHGGNLQVVTARLKQNFYYRALGWENELAYQISSNQDVLPLPDLSVYSNLYLKFKLAKVLSVQVGADLHYNTAYYAPYYEAATQQFQVQDEVKIGNYPLINTYVNFNL